MGRNKFLLQRQNVKKNDQDSFTKGGRVGKKTSPMSFIGNGDGEFFCLVGTGTGAGRQYQTGNSPLPSLTRNLFTLYELPRSSVNTALIQIYMMFYDLSSQIS